MKTLHPKIQELKSKVSGEYLTCRYVESFSSKNIMSMDENPYKDNPRVIRGYLAVWGIKDSYGTVSMRGSFAKSINDRGPNSNAKNKIIHLFMHDMREPVGRYLELVEDDYGLRFAVEIDDVQGTPDRVLRQTKSGTLNQYSYGFNYVWDKMEYDETRDAVLMHEQDLFEGSTLSIKASNPETYTIRSKEDLVKALCELGEDSEDIIQSLPRRQQIEIRQIITRYKSLAENKPLEIKKALDLTGEPMDRIMMLGNYKLNLNNF